MDWRGDRMVTFRLLEKTDHKVIYEYFPEGKEISGKVELDLDTGERKIIEKAEGYMSSYAFHALSRIEKYRQAGEFKETGMAAWY